MISSAKLRSKRVRRRGSPPAFYGKTKGELKPLRERDDDAPAQLTGTLPGFFLGLPLAVSAAAGAFMV